MVREAKSCHQCGREIYFDGICLQCRYENERKEIMNYSQEEISSKIDTICDEIISKKEVRETHPLFTKLVNFRDINTAKIAEVAFENNVFYPAEIYKNASKDVVNSLISIIKKDDLLEFSAGLILSCLAVHGGETIFRAFLELEKNPREWRKQLYVDPSEYATIGGWTFDKEENYIETQYNKCYPLVKGNSEEHKNSPVKTGAKTDEICTSCGCQIINLLEVNGNDSRLDFLGFDGIVKVKTCPNCSCYKEADFSRYSLDGKSELISENEEQQDNYLSDDELNEMAKNSYILGDNSVPLRYAADWEGGSSIGGFAFWVQDCIITKCPDCGKPMKYLAQVQWDTIFDGMEGYAYIEICTECKITAVLHQQT